MADREIALYENGVEYYRGKLAVNECYFRGRIFKDVQKSTGKGPTRLKMTVSNGKKKGTDDWLPSTFVSLTAWGELGEQIADRYADKDEIEVITRFSPSSYNGKFYTDFAVREVIRMKPEAADNPYPSGGGSDSKPVSDYPEDPDSSSDDLPF
jgi:hypothetical protein